MSRAQRSRQAGAKRRIAIEPEIVDASEADPNDARQDRPRDGDRGFLRTRGVGGAR
jgi:hypothetical protein